MIVLAGDCGGTKTNLALLRLGAKGARWERWRSFCTRDFPSLPSLVAEYLRGGPVPDLASVGVAGPVEGGQGRLTNLPWRVRESEIEKACGAAKAYLLNDVQAAAFSIPFLSRRDVAVIARGRPGRGGPIAVFSAGTGLGVALLIRWGGRWIPVATEAGHADFAPRNGREIRLLEYLLSLHGRVSVERVVSGPGLLNVYRFVTEVEKVEEAASVKERLALEDPPRVIAREGWGRRSRACREALRLFVFLFGAAAGNVALQCGATGGLFLAGGLTAAIVPALAARPFREAFTAKGRFRGYLSAVPVRAIVSPRAPLVGAARYALERENDPAPV